uniref:Uncharacterized protein n=1 Tax=Anguilla anguilla TaxID=7936 RepID=A0A0E9QGG3_ANGAN
MADSGKRKIEVVGSDKESEGHGETHKFRKVTGNEPGEGNGAASDFLLSGFEKMRFSGTRRGRKTYSFMARLLARRPWSFWRRLLSERKPFRRFSKTLVWSLK